MYACICRAITDKDVRRAGRAGIISPERLIQTFGLDDERLCGLCVEHIDELVELAHEGAAQAVYDVAESPKRVPAHAHG